MQPETFAQLDRLFMESPIMRADDVPQAVEVDAASHQIGVPFPSDYRQFILRYGGAMVGVYPILGLRSCEWWEMIVGQS